MDLGSEWALTLATAAAADEQFGSEKNATHWWEALDAPCRTELADKMTAFNLALGLILCALVPLSIVPSLTKPYNRKSTEGMSPMSLLLTNFQQTLQVVNMILLKGEQVRLCSGDIIGCQPSLISFYSAFAAWAMLFLQYLCTVWFPEPPEQEVAARNRILWNVQVGSCGFAVIASIVWVSFSRCSENNFLRWTGIFAGLASSVLMMIRFVPQLMVTCQLRSSGSISYITYGMVGVGGFLQTYFNVVGSEEELSTWLPVFVGNCFQTVILLSALYFDISQGKVQEIAERVSSSFAGSNAGSAAEGGRERELSFTGSTADADDGVHSDKTCLSYGRAD